MNLKIRKKACYTPVTTEKGFTIGIVVKGEKGYFKLDYPTVDSWKKAEEWADHLNTRLGLSQNEVANITIQSMRL